MEKSSDSKNDSIQDNILKKVVDVICRVTDMSQDEIKVTTQLISDLQLTPPILKSFATSFTQIAQEYEASASIGMDECLQLVTIQSCVDLIMGKIK